MFDALLRRRQRREQIHFRRWLANAVAAVAGVALLGSIVLWFAGIGTTPAEIKIPGPGYGLIYLGSFQGRMIVGVDDAEPDTNVFWWRGRRSSPGDLYRLVNDEDEYAIASPWGWGWAAPHWVVGIVLCIPLAWRWFVWRDDSEEYHRREHGLCRHCGYDLRASADRCPECGELAPAAMMAQRATDSNAS